MLTAKLAEKQIGQRKGAKLKVKKAAVTKKIILKYSCDFGGSLIDKAVMQLAGVFAKSYYKYKPELKR